MRLMSEAASPESLTWSMRKSAPEVAAKARVFERNAREIGGGDGRQRIFQIESAASGGMQR